LVLPATLVQSAVVVDDAAESEARREFRPTWMQLLSNLSLRSFILRSLTRRRSRQSPHTPAPSATRPPPASRPVVSSPVPC